MPKCGRCGEDVRDAIQCALCLKHFDFPCSGVTESGYRKLGAKRQAAWKCLSCKTVSTTTSQAISPAAKGNVAQGSGSPVTLDQVMEELRSLKLSMATISTAVAGIEGIKEEISKTKGSVETFSSKLNTLEQRVQSIEKSHIVVQQLSDRISVLENNLNEKNQWLRLNNVEIKGVPVEDRENLFDILFKIGTKVQYPISKHDINFIARVPSKDDKTKPIIVSFLNRYMKEEFIAAARIYKALCPEHIDLPGRNSIYVNDHLTVENKMLLNKARDLKNEKDYEFVWVKNAKIFARKNKESRTIMIKNEQDLLKMQ